MSGGELTPAELRARHDAAIREADTFQPRGVSRDQALDFLDTAEGKRYLDQLRSVDPDAPITRLVERAVGQIKSGVELPTARLVEEPLYKLVPSGAELSTRSPFFTTEAELARALNSGQSVVERFGLPITSEAQRYDVYRMRPNGAAEVFSSTVAPTEELSGAVRRSGGAVQYLAPSRGQFHAPELVGTIEHRLAPGHTYRPFLSGPSLAQAADAPPIRTGGVRPGVALGVAGAALAAYDAADTGFRIRGHLASGNATAAESEAIHFGGRTVGGLAGVGLGMAVGGAAGIKTGPGALVTAAAGGVVGAVAGDKIASWWDDRSINTQTDRQGNEWKLDPERPDLGWRRRAPVDGTQDGIDNARREPLRASPLLESELNFQATRRSAELVLGSPPVPRDPFTQPSHASDSPSVVAAPWVRSQEGTWQRTTTLAYAERGLSPTRTEVATPERAAQLDQAAARIIVQNAENSAPVIAARFEAAYAAQGWARFGPMPDAVTNARTNLDSLVASDGDTYSRQPDGAWVSRGMVMDSAADGNVREELEATRTLLASRLPPSQQVPTPPPLSADDRLRDTVIGAYRNAGLELSPAQLDERARAVAESWRTHGLSPETTALRVAPSGGTVGIDQPIESLRLEPDGRTYRIAATTLVGTEGVEQAVQRSQPAPAMGGPAPSGRSREREDRETEVALPRPKLANDPSHPDHATFSRIHSWVRGTGQWDEEHSLNVSAALYREQASNPLIQRVDRVVGGLGQDGAQNAFAVYAPHGDKEPTFHAHVDGRVASQQPAEQSLAQAERVTQERNQQQALAQDQEQQARGGQVLSR